jgi:hypothetical protein
MASEFKPDQALKVTAAHSVTGDRLILNYIILDTGVSDRWIKLINENLNRKNGLRYNYRKILTADEIVERLEAFRANVTYINDHYDRVLPVPRSLEWLRTNQGVLNDLHEQFEIYGDRLDHLVQVGYFSDPQKFPDLYNPVWPGGAHENDKVTHEAFLLLNEQIHNFESIFRNWDKQHKTLCTCLWDFVPAGLHEDLEPEDYLLFSPEHHWGWAYLGYNTLGKHWSSACHDNDIEVVRRHQIRPQTRFAAETYLNFSLRPTGYGTQVKLYNWWKNNGFSEFIDPDLRLRELALGYIPLGRLYSYRINDQPSVTKITDKTDRAEWNQTVWSRFNSIVAVEVIDV